MSAKSDTRENDTVRKLQALQRMVHREEVKDHGEKEKQETQTRRVAHEFNPALPNIQRRILNTKRKIQLTHHMLLDISAMMHEHEMLRGEPANHDKKAKAEKMMRDLEEMNGDLVLLGKPEYVVPEKGEVVVSGGFDVDAASNTVSGYLNRAHDAINQLQALQSQVMQGMHSAQTVLSQNKEALRELSSSAQSAANGILGTYNQMQRR